jgi:hypothetical protein
LNASTEGLATTSTVLDDEEGDSSNDEENSNVTVDKNSSYNGMNGKDDVDDEDTNSKSPHASSPHGNHSTKPASTSPLAVRSSDGIGSGRSTSPISPSSSPTTKEVLTNQQAQQQQQQQAQLFPLPSNEHEMSEAVKRVIASVYSEATKSAFSPIMASTYLNHHHHQNRLFAAPYPPHPLYFHHPPPPPIPSSMSILSRTTTLGTGPRHQSHHRCILPFCTCKLVAPPSSSPSTN